MTPLPPDDELLPPPDDDSEDLPPLPDDEEDDIPPPHEDPPKPSGYPDLCLPIVKSAPRFSREEQTRFFVLLAPTGLDYPTVCAWCGAYQLPRPSFATHAERAEYLASYEAIHEWARLWRHEALSQARNAVASLERAEKGRRSYPKGFIGVGKLLSKAMSGKPPATDLDGILSRQSIGELVDIGSACIKMELELRNHPEDPPPATGSAIAAELAAMTDDPISSLEE